MEPMQMSSLGGAADHVALRRGRVPRLLSLTIAAVLAATGLLLAGASSAAAWPSVEHPETVSADGLPTVQIDGVAWAQAIVGDIVYVGGEFNNARPAGSGTGDNVPRNNMLAYDIETGALIPSFAPNPNAQVRTITPSPDGSIIYVGGDFTSIAGSSRSRIAAFDAVTGQLISGFAPPVGYHVWDIAVANDVVYIGGNFLSVGSTYRGRLAAFDAATGALLNWAPDAPDRPVRAVEISPDGSKLAVGGAFETLNGSTSFGKGLAVLDATTGEILAHAATDLIRNGGADAAITSLHADGDLLYGTGYHFGAGGTLEGSFASTWDDGTLAWVNNCHGDVLGIHAAGDVVYSVGHSHHCGDIDGFGQRDGSDGRWDEYRATATTKAAAGTVATNRYGGNYSDFGGNPRPDLLNFFPAISNGTYTGTYNGAWDVTGNDRYVIMGGEFNRVNFQNQQGLVRFARRDLAPNNQGPNRFNASYPIKVQSFWDDAVTITWPGNIDRDEATLNYRVFRRAVGGGGSGQLVHERDTTAPFWALPMMTYTDRDGAGPGFEYRVQVRDGYANFANSSWTPVAMVGGGSDYLATVLESEPDSLWRLGESSGSTVATDTVGFRDASVPTSGVALGQDGAITDDPDTAAQFSGTDNNHFVRTTEREHPPQIFSLEAWVKAESNGSGGLIVGFNRSDSGDGDTARQDRHLYMDTSGRAQFALNPTNPVTIRSEEDLRDGEWHHLVGTLGGDGMNLYVDGRRVATRPDITNGRTGYQGFIRIGSGALNGFPDTNTGSGRRFNGTIDDVALYRSVLTPQAVRTHYEASGRVTDTANTPPVASFTSTVSELTASFDALDSVDLDGTIDSYQWDFGDSTSGSGVAVEHTYSAPGTYTVSLTVTDDDGATDTAASEVVAYEPSDVLHRVNTGGPRLDALDNALPWGADTSGSPSVFRVAGGENTAGGYDVKSVEDAVPATTPAQIFETARWDPPADPEMRWAFPVDEGTPVAIRLYLMNGYSGTSNPGQRVFDIALDGTTVISGLDLSAEAGHEVGTVRTLTTVSDGSIDLEFLRDVENPLINGIEIVAIDEVDPAPGALAADPTELVFGEVDVDTARTQTVTLTNSGGVPVAIGQLAVEGADAAMFAVTGEVPGEVAAGGSEAVEVSFSPTAAGEVSATLTVTHDGDISPLEIALSGTGVIVPAAGMLSADPVAVDFGEVEIGTTGEASTTLTNTGDTPLSVSGATIDGSADFTVISMFPIELEPGASAELDVTFKPVTEGGATATMSVEHTGTNTPLVVALSGVGIAEPVVCDAGVWSAEYFNNMTLTGDPVVVRCDAAIDFAWGHGSPDPLVNVNRFSALWTLTDIFEAGDYRLSATADDGVRVFVDGALVIDGWVSRKPTTYIEVVPLDGEHTIVMEYYERTSVATAKFAVAPLEPAA